MKPATFLQKYIDRLKTKLRLTKEELADYDAISDESIVFKMNRIKSKSKIISLEREIDQLNSLKSKFEK
jgi:hypothetical protein